jgi:hypothetical protein
MNRKQRVRQRQGSTGTNTDDVGLDSGLGTRVPLRLSSSSTPTVMSFSDLSGFMSIFFWLGAQFP